ncbi:MAG: sensor histidine kinase, partial [Leptospiraceae bacterium]|nr:sensor histidine kinase [Leptospiraceae bacterium]
MKAFLTYYFRLIAASAWLLLTLSLGFWWMIIGLRQAKLVFALQEALGGNIAKESQQRLKRYSLMITTEGGFFLLLLGTGGITLIYLSYRDMQNTRVLKEFFSTVSHEMKTPLASIRLQVESLQEDLFDSEH